MDTHAHVHMRMHIVLCLHTHVWTHTHKRRHTHTQCMHIMCLCASTFVCTLSPTCIIHQIYFLWQNLHFFRCSRLIKLRMLVVFLKASEMLIGHASCCFWFKICVWTCFRVVRRTVMMKTSMQKTWTCLDRNLKPRIVSPSETCVFEKTLPK